MVRGLFVYVRQMYCLRHAHAVNAAISYCFTANFVIHIIAKDYIAASFFVRPFLLVFDNFKSKKVSELTVSDVTKTHLHSIIAEK